MMGSMSTRGIRSLREKGIPFEEVDYIYKKKGASRAAQAVGWAEEQTIKSLVVRTGEKDLYFVLVPSHLELSLKKLARLLNVKSVEMASVRDAERLTGYKEGGISPFGAYADFPVVMEQTLLEHERVVINGGRRGVLVALSPWDIQELLNAAVEDVVSE